MKKILFISTNDGVPWGGSEVLWFEAAKKIVTENGSDYGVMASARQWKEEPSHLEQLRRLGVKIGYRTFNSKPFRAINIYNRFFSPKISLQDSREFFSDLLLLKPDLVVFSLGDHNSSADKDISYCRKNKIPYVVIFQLVKGAHVPHSAAVLDTISLNLMAAEKLYFVSHQNKEVLQKQCATHFNNSEIISNPIPRLDSAVPEFPSLEFGYQMAFVASLSTNHKGHDVLFNVLSDTKWKERPLMFNLYGSGPHADYLLKLKKYYDLYNIAFKGNYQNLKDVWSVNHAGVLCSRFEGQSLALLETLSNNRMCAATNVGDASVLIEDGVTGFIANAATPELVDYMLERAWFQRENWEKMGVLSGLKVREIIREDPIDSFTKKLLQIV
jgi:glycosyltransferase involved in cell wall biosynthesis